MWYNRYIINITQTNMAKKIKEADLRKKEALKALLVSELPHVFEREPAPAFVEGTLDALIDDILILVK